MNFKTRKISNKIKKPKKEINFSAFLSKFKNINLPKVKINGISASILASILIIVILVFGIVKVVKSMDFKLFLSIAGEKLQTDEYGHSNFLILGSGGKNHDGGDLTDTILLASLDQENNLVNMVSIPRDLYIKDDTIGSSRINEIYYNAKNFYGSSIEGLNYFKTKIQEIVGVPIHYYLMVDFEGFKQIVDILGGVDINVEDAIYDPYYPKDGTYLYETFSISAGPQHLDGETALKYARSRKTTSDFDRAARQQQIIFALKEKAMESDILLNTDKINEILETLKANIETNIKVKEILTLGAIAGDYTKDKITQNLIHDNQNNCGGFLYTPAREFYNGMFVLVPAGGFEFLEKYLDLKFNFPIIEQEHAKLHILNGTHSAGIAGEAKQILKRYCFDVIRFGNALNNEVTETTYYYSQKYDEKGKPIDSRPKSLDFLQKLIPGKESPLIPEDYKEYAITADIILEIGTDYTNSENYIDDPFYYLVNVYTAPSSESTDATTSE